MVPVLCNRAQERRTRLCGHLSIDDETGIRLTGGKSRRDARGRDKVGAAPKREDRFAVPILVVDELNGLCELAKRVRCGFSIGSRCPGWKTEKVESRLRAPARVSASARAGGSNHGRESGEDRRPLAARICGEFSSIERKHVASRRRFVEPTRFCHRREGAPDPFGV
jgi:hypothetical protein